MKNLFKLCYENPDYRGFVKSMFKVKLLILMLCLSFIGLAQNTTNRSTWGNTSVIEKTPNNLIESRHDLMAKYAPVFLQKINSGRTITGTVLKDGEDFLSAIDFDKNWSTYYTPWDGVATEGHYPSGTTAASRVRDDNYYDATDSGFSLNDQVPTVYGQMFESTTYWIMRYNVYHSYNRIPLDNHKNDGESATLFVEKSTGKVKYAQTVVHAKKPIYEAKDLIFDGTHVMMYIGANGALDLANFTHGHAIVSLKKVTPIYRDRGLTFYPAMNQPATAIPNGQSFSSGWKTAGAPSNFLTGDNKPISPTSLHIFNGVKTYNLVPLEEAIAKWRAPEKTSGANKYKMGNSSGPTSWGGQMYDGAWMTYDTLNGLLSDLGTTPLAQEMKNAIGTTAVYDVKGGKKSRNFWITTIGGTLEGELGWDDVTNFGYSSSHRYANISGGGNMGLTKDKFRFYYSNIKTKGISALVRRVGNNHLIDGYNSNPENKAYGEIKGATGGIMIRKEFSLSSDFAYAAISRESKHPYLVTRYNGKLSVKSLTRYTQEDNWFLFRKDTDGKIRLYIRGADFADVGSKHWNFTGEVLPDNLSTSLGATFYAGLATLSNVDNPLDKFYWVNSEYDYITLGAEGANHADFNQYTYSFEEEQGAIAYNKLSSKSHAANKNGYTSIDGRVNKAWKYNGSNQYNTFLSNENIELDGDFTIAAWVYLNGTVGAEDALVGFDGRGNDINFFEGRPRLYTSSFTDVAVSSVAVESDMWTHVAITRKGNAVKTYINGNVTGTGTWSGSFTIKSIARGSAGYFEGAIDELIIREEAYDSYTIKSLPGFRDLEAHWKLDGDFKDSTNLHSGSGSGDGSFVKGRDGDAYMLDAPGEYAKVPKVNLPGDFTIAGWVRLDPGIDNRDALVGNNGSGDDINFYQSHPGMYISEADGTIGNTAVTIQPNVWTHVAFTRSGIRDANNPYNVHLYVDGIKYPVSEGTNYPFSFSYLGAGKQGSIVGTRGLIDDVRVYNTAKTAAEIKTWAGFRDLEAHWTFNRPGRESTIIKDISGNGHDGIAHGGEYIFDGIHHSYKMDGDGDYIKIDEIGLGRTFTVMGWMFLAPGISNDDAMVGNNGNGDDFNFYQSHPGVYFSGVDGTVGANATIDPEHWYHFAIVRNGSRSKDIYNVKIYINGIKMNTSTGTDEVFSFNTLGAGKQGAKTKGMIADMRVYNSPKTAVEIKTIMKEIGTSGAVARKKSKPLAVEEDAIISSINLYPNPAKDAFSFTIPTQFKQSKVNVSISDISGKVVQTDILQNNNTNKLSVKTNTLSNGIYFVKIDIDNTSVTKKLLINR